MQGLQNLIYAVLVVQTSAYSLTSSPSAALAETYCPAAGCDGENDPAGFLDSTGQSSHVEVQGDIGARDEGFDFVRKLQFQDKGELREVRSNGLFDAKRSGDADLVDVNPEPVLESFNFPSNFSAATGKAET